MIEVESKVYSPIYLALREEYGTGIFVTSEPVAIPNKPLVVGIVQQDSYSSQRRQDNTLKEKFSTVMFQVDVYSNKAPGKKSQCKEVMGFVDKLLFRMNFMRISLNPVPMEETGYYRLTARYRAETDGETFYRV